MRETCRLTAKYQRTHYNPDSGSRSDVKVKGINNLLEQEWNLHIKKLRGCDQHTITWRKQGIKRVRYEYSDAGGGILRVSYNYPCIPHSWESTVGGASHERH